MRRVNRWRCAAFGMAALLAALTWIAARQEYERRHLPTHYIGVLPIGDGKHLLFHMRIDKTGARENADLEAPTFGHRPLPAARQQTPHFPFAGSHERGLADG